MARCREHYDALFVNQQCNLIGDIGLRSILNHHRTPCIGYENYIEHLVLDLCFFYSLNLASIKTRGYHLSDSCMM